MTTSSRLTFKLKTLLGIIVWIQSADDVKREEHPAAIKFFCSHNPQSIDLFKASHQQIQLGVVKVNLPKERFVDSAIKAAIEQSKNLDPCILVIQQGNLEIDNPSEKHLYLICSFFRAQKASIVLPQPRTQIILEE
jgi:hypothetical protein